MEKKCFLKAEMRYQGPLQEDVREVYIDIGSISVIEPTANGINVKLSNAEGDYYVKDWHYYTLDNVIECYRRNR